MTEHIVTKKQYALIFGILMVLTLATTAIGMIDLGRLNVVVALVIATIKALLVVLFFMHIYWSSKLNKLVVVSGVAWLSLPDYWFTAFYTGSQVSNLGNYANPKLDQMLKDLPGDAAPAVYGEKTREMSKLVLTEVIADIATHAPSFRQIGVYGNCLIRNHIGSSDFL